MDGGDILSYFNQRIAAEIRLPEAIDRKLLAPFQYFGVTDTAQLDQLTWSRGGLCSTELSNLYTISGMVAEKRAGLVLASVQKYVTDLTEVKGLGFCVSVAHAQFMSELFNRAGISAMVLTGKSSETDRYSAKDRLVNGEIRFIFVVDIYNEGVDIPEVNTVLFLRPTQSLDFIDKPLDLRFASPLDLHCTYSRDQLLVAMDFMKPSTVCEGVKFLPDKKIDVFFITLNKSDKDYSPTTMYHDYSMNDVLFRWQSQGTTSEISATGMRYRKHRENGHKILLFVREFKEDKRSKTASPYTFLGTANYVSHQGSRPMNITWKLDHPIPAKFLKKTNTLVVN